MLKYIVKRLLQMIPMLLVLTLVVFFMVRLIPGDPVTMMLGQGAGKEAIAAETARLGLDKPLWEQYLIWMGNLFLNDLRLRTNIDHMILHRTSIVNSTHGRRRHRRISRLDYSDDFDLFGIGHQFVNVSFIIAFIDPYPIDFLIKIRIGNQFKCRIHQFIHCIGYAFTCLDLIAIARQQFLIVFNQLILIHQSQRI